MGPQTLPWVGSKLAPGPGLTHTGCNRQTKFSLPFATNQSRTWVTTDHSRLAWGRVGASFGDIMSTQKYIETPCSPFAPTPTGVHGSAKRLFCTRWSVNS